MEPDTNIPVIGGDFTLAQLERAHIEKMIATKPSLQAAADTLGIDPATLYRKRKRWEERKI